MLRYELVYVYIDINVYGGVDKKLLKAESYNYKRF